MTTQKSFKRLVRARMEKTGESYTTARAQLLTASEPESGPEPVLITSDGAIRERTGRGWEEWFDMLDDWGAAERPHREIARWVAAQLSIEPLAWNAQAITVSYERTRGLREVGERSDGSFTATISRTVAVPVEDLYDTFADEALRERTATQPKSARFDFGDNGSRVHVTFLAKGEGKSTVALEHTRLPDAGEVERMKAYWRERLDALKSQLEAR
jgi:uncharacterized protein YndB with AHSA1/START domain